MYTPRRPNKPRRLIYSIDELPAYCDCCDVGLYLRVNPETVSKLAREGVLRGAKIGQSWRVPQGGYSGLREAAVWPGRGGTAR